MRTMTPAERLIVAADYRPVTSKGNCQREVRNKILALAKDLSKTGVYLKVNSAGMGGIVCSPKESESARRFIAKDMTINTPDIRPEWAMVLGDDQNPERAMTPAEAIKARANRIIVGRPITQAKSPYDATMR